MGIVRHADAGEPLAVDGGRAQRRADADARSEHEPVASSTRSSSCARPSGLPYLRHDRAAELALDPAPLTVDGERIAAFEADARRRRAHRRQRVRGAARASSTATPTCRSPGGARRSTSRRSPACPTRRSRAPAAGSRRALAPSRRPPTTQVLAQARALRAEMLARRHDGLRGARPATACRSSGERARRAPGPRARRRPGHRAVRPRRPAGLRRRRVDGRRRRAGRGVRRRRARHLRGVGRLRNEDLARLGAIAAREGVPLRAHVEQFNAQPLGARRAGRGRALGRPPRVPAPRRRRAARRGRVRRGPAPRRRVPRGRARRRRGATLADAGAICVLATDLNPGTSPVSSLPVVIGPRRAPLRLERARGAAGVHAERGVGARPVRRARARWRSASAPTSCSSTPPSPTSPTASGATRCAWSSAPARSRGCARTPRGGSPRDRRRGPGAAPGRPRAHRPGRARHHAAGVDARGRGRGRVVRAPRGGGRAARRDRPGRQPLGGARHARAVVGRRLAPGQRAVRRALRRRARACAPASRSPSTRPVAVIAFADEEGARFNTPTFGSRALVRRSSIRPCSSDATTTACDWPTRWPPPASIPPGVAEAPAWLGRLRGFLELHVDQTPDLERFAVVRAPGGADARAGRPARPRRSRRDHAPP